MNKGPAASSPFLLPGSSLTRSLGHGNRGCSESGAKNVFLGTSWTSWAAGGQGTAQLKKFSLHPCGELEKSSRARLAQRGLLVLPDEVRLVLARLRFARDPLLCSSLPPRPSAGDLSHRCGPTRCLSSNSASRAPKKGEVLRPGAARVPLRVQGVVQGCMWEGQRLKLGARPTESLESSKCKPGTHSISKTWKERNPKP